MIIAVPFATEVTSPPPDGTVAMNEFDVAHMTVAPEITDPAASFTVAVSVAVSANEANERLVGDSVTEDVTRVTVVVAVALAEPLVAVIVAVPSATAVTSPADDTVATDELDVAHVTVAPEIVVPPASVTVGVSVAVAPIDANERLVGDSVTEDAT